MSPNNLKMDGHRLLEIAGPALILIALCWNLFSSWKLYSRAGLSDPGGYPEMARASHCFYDSGMREPVPIFLTKTMLAFGAGDDRSVRLATALVFAAAVVLMIFLMGGIYGRVAGLAAALIFALNPYAGYYAVQGVSNLTSGLFLLLFWFLLVKGGEVRWRAAFAGAAGALCMLTRLENLLVVLAALGVFAALDLTKRRLRFCAAAAAISLLLTLPYLVQQYRTFGNPVYSHAMAARFWLNTEQKGPHSVDRYKGGPMGISAFIFRKGPAQAGAGLLKAYGKSFFHYIPRLLYYKLLLLPVLLAGLFFLFRKKDYFTLLLLPALILPITFISTINQVSAGSGIELRFYLNALWLLCAYCGEGIAGAAALLARPPDLPAGQRV
ncbi:MAG: glycosyltransferase family 39 protein [Elusimicrobia bacterium]|nr:glycosyltransferase family 39 protein [Elusimicrobiota bacterium]